MMKLYGTSFQQGAIADPISLSFYAWALKVKCCTRIVVNFKRVQGYFQWQKMDFTDE